jgi:hypothetical protein
MEGGLSIVSRSSNYDFPNAFLTQYRIKNDNWIVSSHTGNYAVYCLLGCDICIVVEVSRRFGGTYHLLIQDQTCK